MQPRLRSRALLHDIAISELAELASAFHAELAARKTATPHEGFDWYPFDSFGTLTLLDRVLTGRARYLRPLIGEEPVLDIGCGDGDLAFLLEALGAKVHAVDNPPTNYNGMRGVKALKSALRSRLRISAADLDARFDLPLAHCGLALFFGVLYHLKNPFGILESLAARARYCLLSTAITRYAPDERTDLSALPLAFLAGRDGLRGDETNYWIFTEMALRQLVERTGWEVCDWAVVDDRDSTLWGTQRDQRAICLLRSRVRPPVESTQLLAGWHKLENDAWRWTERRFSVALAAPATVKLRLTVPPVIPCPVALHAAGVRQTFAAPGSYDFEVPADRGTIEFELDRALAPEAGDRRERGIIVNEISV